MDISHETAEFICGEYGIIYINLGICLITFVIGLYFVTIGIKGMLSRKNITNQLKISYAISCSTFIIFNVLYVILCGFCIAGIFSHVIYIYSIHLLFYSLQLDILCLNFAFRLQITFGRSQFYISSSKLYAIYIVLITVVIAHILITIGSIVLFAHIEIIISLSFVTIIIYFILSWTLIVLFINRLRLLTVGRSDRYLLLFLYFIFAHLW